MWKLILVVVLSLISAGVQSIHFTFGYSQNNQVDLLPNIIERVECVFTQAGHSVAFKELPVARISSLLKHGKLDGDIGRVTEFVKVGDPVVKIPTPIVTANIWIYGRKGLNIYSLSDLPRYKMISVLGIAYFDRYNPQKYARGDQARSFPLALKMVLGGRGDYTFGTGETWSTVVSNGWGSALTRYPAEPVEKILVHTLLHEKHANEVKHLDALIQKMKEGKICSAET